MRRAKWLGSRGRALLLSVGTVVSLLTLAAAAQVPRADDAGSSQGKAGQELVGNRSTRTYHLVDCALISKLSVRSKVDLKDVAAAQAAGFKPCTTCKPPTEPGAASEPLADDSGLGAEARKLAAKKGAGKGRTGDAEPSLPLDSGPLKFSRDIAPILAGNCMSCHNDQQKRGEFNLSSFQKMLEGSQSGPVLVPGKPEQSVLVQMVVSRKMPRGGNRRLANEAIARIERWVAEGAILDAGVSPTDSLDKIKPSPEQIRREEMARLSPEVRDQKIETTGRERLKKASPQWEPKLLSGRGFVVFHALPEDRAKNLLRVLEAQKTVLTNLIGNRAEALGGPEKLSVYVLNDASTYTEFVRSVEQREVELGAEGHARFNADAPYIVVTDPLSGGDEPAASARTPKSSRKKADDSDLAAGSSRTLPGLATEQLTAGALAASGKAPRWLAEGLGAYLAAQVEPRGPYVQKLRAEALQQVQLGWDTRSNEVLGDQGSVESLRALGFTLCEWMASTGYRDQFPAFVRALCDDGGAKLDDVLKRCFGNDATRQAFQTAWGEFVAARYGR